MKNTPNEKVFEKFRGYYKTEEELEKDRKKQSKKYYKKQLKEIGFNLEILEKDTVNKIIDFFQKYKEEEAFNQNLFSCLKKKKEIYISEKGKIAKKMQRILEQKNKEKFKRNNEELVEIFTERKRVIDAIEKNISEFKKAREKIVFNSSVDSYKSLIKFNATEFINYNNLIMKLLKVYRKGFEIKLTKVEKILYNVLSVRWLFDVLHYSFKDMYFASSIEKKYKIIFYEKAVTKLNEFYNGDKIYEEVLKEEYDILVFSFFSFKGEVEDIESENFSIETNKLSENELIHINQEDLVNENLRFKDINKKDKLFKEKKFKIEKLIEILDNVDSGLILSKNLITKKELFKILDNKKYKNRKLFKIVGEIVDYYEKDVEKRSVNQVNIDEEDKRYLENLNAINKIIKVEINLRLGKYEENKALDEIIDLVTNINNKISKNISPDLINLKLFNFLDVVVEIVEEINLFYQKNQELYLKSLLEEALGY